MSSSSGRGFGKIILFGEHFVVHGAPGIVAGLNKGIEVLVDRAGKDKIIGPWDGPMAREVLSKIKEMMGIESSYVVKVNEEIISGAGLGASAAFSVALIKALAKAEDKELSQEEVFKLSYEAEKTFHGTPSGIDNAAATYGGLAVFVKGQHPKPLSLGKELNLLVTYTGKKGSTKELVASVRKLSEEFPKQFEKLLESYKVVYEKAMESLLLGDLSSIGKLMNINHGLLSSIGVSSKEIEDIVHTARNMGAYGSKLTGAGGGGCVISLVENEVEAEKISSELPYKSFFAKVR